MILQLIKEAGKWCQVKLPQTASGEWITGYVHSSIVKFIEEKPQTESTPVPPPPVEQPKKIKSSKKRMMGLGFKLSGGMNTLTTGDVNDGNEGFNHYLDLFGEIYGMTINSDVNLINYGLDFKGEILIELIPHFRLAVGGGYIRGSSLSETIFTGGVTDNWSWTTKPIMSAIPVTFSLYYDIFQGKKINFFINAGGGVYFASFSHNFHTDYTDNWNDEQSDATAIGIGFHGGLGFEYYVSSNIGIVFEAAGRYANISGFEGTYVDTDSDGNTDERTGKLFYYEFTNSDGKVYKMYKIRENFPTGVPYTSNIRDAKVDFSGFGIKIGIVIRLGK